LWANAAISQLCATGECSESGTYDANSSSTYEFVNNDFNISYLDGSSAVGDYAKDTFHFGGKTLKGLQFGIGYESSSAQGILGIGYAINEVQVGRAGGQPYPNLPQLLVDSGTINSNAYSLWLNDLDASTGSILFGGVDTEKYVGSLSKLPIIPEAGRYREFVIALTALGRDGTKGSIFQNETLPVLLDSGSSLMYLPDNVAQSLYKTYKATYDTRQGAAFVDCDLANQQGSLEFTFSGPTISVPLNELVVVVGYSRRQPVCIFGVSPAGDSIAILGDTFLRSAYVVYDLQNNQIALAQTNFNATKSSIAEIVKGADGVPNASGVPNAVSTAPVPSGGARIGGPSITPTNAAAPTSTGAAAAMVTSHPWLSGAAVAGAGILLGFNGL